MNPLPPDPNEKTHKLFKSWQALGFILIVVGVVARIGSGEVAWSMLAMLGFVLWLGGKVGAWWRSG